MVGYSSVRVDCPSVAFLFAHLGCLLEVVEGECLKWVSFLVGEDFLYRFFLSSIFPLVSHSTRVARLLKMSGKLGLLSWKRGCLRLMIARFSKLLPLLLPIRPRISNVPS